MYTLQYCAKEMQMKFAEISEMTWISAIKFQTFVSDENVTKFRSLYCSNVGEILQAMWWIERKFRSMRWNFVGKFHTSWTKFCVIRTKFCFNEVKLRFDETKYHFDETKFRFHETKFRSGGGEISSAGTKFCLLRICSLKYYKIQL